MSLSWEKRYKNFVAEMNPDALHTQRQSSSVSPEESHLSLGPWRPVLQRRALKLPTWKDLTHPST